MAQRTMADKASEDSKQQASEKAPRENGLGRVTKALGTGTNAVASEKGHLADL